MRQKRKPSCFEFPFRLDVARLRADLNTALARDWSEHHNIIHHGSGWSGLALRSISGDVFDLKASFLHEFQNTEILAACPYFREIVERLECPVKSVRLLRLAAGARVRTHVDNGLGYDFGMVRLHVPVVTNSDVRFVLAGHLLELREGKVWYVDTSYPHSVANGGDVDRVHLVIDCVVNDWLKAQFPAEFQRDMTPLELAAGYTRGYAYSVVDAARRLRMEPRKFGRKVLGRVSRLGRSAI